MNNQTYDLIWNQIVKISQSLINEIDKDVLKEVELKLCINKKDGLLTEYRRIKQDLRDKYYSGNCKDKRICHHKKAACFCEALLVCKLISFDIVKLGIGKSEYRDKLVQINYRLAFWSGLCIVYYFLLDYYITTKQLFWEEKDFSKNKLLEMEALYLPKANDTHDTFEEGVVKMLGINETNGLSFNCLCFSYIYYFIELHNIDLIRKLFLAETKAYKFFDEHTPLLEGNKEKSMLDKKKD